MKLNEEYFRIRTTMIFAPLTMILGLFFIFNNLIPEYLMKASGFQKLISGVLIITTFAGVALFGYVTWLAYKTYRLDVLPLDKEIRKQSFWKLVRAWIEE